MVVAPEVIPVTTPAFVTVAVAAVLLAHVPPEVISVSVIVLPVHTALLPEIPAGGALSVINEVIEQPEAAV